MFPGVTNMVKIYICILLTVALIFTAVYKSCSSMETDQSWLEEGGTQTCLLCTYNATNHKKESSQVEFLGILFYKNDKKLESV